MSSLPEDNYANLEVNQITLHGDVTNDLHAATKEYVDLQIENLVSGAPSYLDTLKEIADFLGAEEGETASDILTRIETAGSNTSAVSDALSTEIVDRTSAVASLETSLLTELGDLSSELTTNVGTLQSEISNVEDQVDALSIRLTSEISTVNVNMDQLSTDLEASIVSEVSDLRSDMEVDLSGKFDVADNGQYVKHSDGNFQIGEGTNAYLYIGNHWRIAANNNLDNDGKKRLVFDYNPLETTDAGFDDGWKTAIPFIQQ